MSNTFRPRIAYYCARDPLDKRSWSGITYYLGKSLQKHIGEVYYLGPVKVPWLLDMPMRCIQKLTKLILKKEWAPSFSLLRNMYMALLLKKKMKKDSYDFLFAPAAASELAYLKTKVPIVYFGDATFKSYTESYEEFKDLNAFSRWEGDYLEKKALRKSDIVIFASNWAAQSAIRDYGIQEDKIKVLLMGANMDNVPDSHIITKKEENKVLTLLFLGVDWERKGGPLACETLKSLRSMGIQTKLIVCGVVPPSEFINPFIEVIPFLNKNKEEDHERFVRILSSTHFLLIPTRADCSLLVNNEANAFGVPTITTNVGGVADVVKDGVNGYCLPFMAGGAEYATLIASIYQDKCRYHQLALSSRKRFEEVLNWDSFSQQLKNVLTQRHLYSI